MIATPNFELKLLVDAERVLEPDGAPTDVVRTTLNIDDSKSINMQFVDGARLELQQLRWNLRIRAFEGEPKLELTCKKRYPVDADDINAILAVAERDGFGAGLADCEAQIEWGRDGKTLTFSIKAVPDSPESDPMDLPGESHSRQLWSSALPSRLEQEKSKAWIGGVLQHAHVYGPVHGKRWIGKLDGKKLSMEVWNVRGEPGGPDDRVVEVSVKEDDFDLASARFSRLSAVLDEGRWLLDRAMLKTEMILERY